VSARGRIVAVDMLKGVAIVWVMLIHANLFGGTVVMSALINHAVPIFVVLSGLNSELWWERRTVGDLGTWLWSRARRLYPPLWAMLAVWWAMALCSARPLGPLSWTLAARHAIGDLQWVDTGWFVTLLVQLLVVFPFLHFAARRLGDLPVLAFGLVCLLATITWRFWLLGPLGYGGLLVFAPRMFAHLTFGMLLAHHLDWLTPRTALAALALVVPGWLVHGGVIAPALGEHAAWLLDLPLTVVLLVAMEPLARRPWIARPLAWLGVHSWGLYLGQILVIAAIAFPMGRAWAPAHLAPVVYAPLLLGGAIALVWAGNALRCLTSRTASVNLAT
jgi:peptidoglycan/LPS O-acetylase OafA/YrhL